MYKPSIVWGDWAVICDRCGFKFKASQLKQEWTGLMVCTKCYEERHPQDFLQSVPDQQSVPWTRREQPDQFQSFVQIAHTIHSYQRFNTTQMVYEYANYFGGDSLDYQPDTGVG